MSDQRVEGKVVAIRGAVVDLAFEGALPPIEDAVEIFDSDGRIVVAEIQAHIDAHTARAIALEPTNGLRRGDSARGAGGPVTVAVGESTLGRLMDVLGRIGDRGPPLPPDAPRWPIHRKPPPFSAQTGTTKIFATGVKVIDLLAPLAQRRQGGDVRRRRGRQDRAGDGTDPRHGREPTRASPSSPASASGRARGMRCCST